MRRLSALFIVTMFLIVKNTEAKTISGPNTDKIGVGLLQAHLRGTITETDAREILHAFVDYTEDDKEFLRGYVRKESELKKMNYSMDDMRLLVIDKLTLMNGQNPEVEGISSDEAHALIDQLKKKKVTYSDWEKSGWLSTYILKEGPDKGQIGGWIPDRGTGNILFYGTIPGFDLFCMNPILTPGEKETPKDEPEPEDDSEQEPKKKTVRRTADGINITITNTNTNHSKSESKSPQGANNPPVVQERRRSGLLEFLGGAAVGYVVGRVTNRPQDRFFGGNRQQTVRMSQPGYRPPSRAHSPIRISTPQQRYNTYQLNPTVGSNQGGSVGRTLVTRTSNNRTSGNKSTSRTYRNGPLN